MARAVSRLASLARNQKCPRLTTTVLSLHMRQSFTIRSLLMRFTGFKPGGLQRKDEIVQNGIQKGWIQMRVVPCGGGLYSVGISKRTKQLTVRSAHFYWYSSRRLKKHGEYNQLLFTTIATMSVRFHISLLLLLLLLCTQASWRIPVHKTNRLMKP